MEIQGYKNLLHLSMNAAIGDLIQIRPRTTGFEASRRSFLENMVAMNDAGDAAPKCVKGESAGNAPVLDDELLEGLSGEGLSNFLNALPDMVCVCVDGNIRYINAAGATILGAPSADDFIGTPFQSLISNEFAFTIEDILRVIADEKEPTSMHFKGLHGERVSLSVCVRSFPLRGLQAFMITGQNLTRQEELSKAVQRGKVRFQRLVNRALDLICVLDDGVITYINQAGTTLLKVNHEKEVLGKPFNNFLHADYKDIMGSDLSDFVDDNSAELLPLRFVDIHQKPIDVAVRIASLDEDDRSRVMIEARDITAHNRAVRALRHSIETLEQRVEERTSALRDEISERRRAEEMLRHVASHDGLTDLPNRSLFMDRLDRAIAKAHRDGRKCAVMFIDLDGFKPVNDTYGHDKGDLLLRAVAKRLNASIRETDTAARFGGDEFVLVITDINDVDDCEPVAKKIMAHLNVPIKLEGVEAKISASIGIALYPDHGTTTEEVLKQADMAMYVVKGDGKNNFAFAGSKVHVEGFDGSNI